MYDTENRLPEQQRRRRVSRTLANLGIAAGGTGVAYGGIRVGQAVGPLSKKIGTAADVWAKSAPSVAAAKPGKGILKRVLRKFYYQSKDKEIRFQKRGEKGYKPKPGSRSGEMAKKWLAGTPFTEDPEWRRTVEAATIRRPAQLRTAYTKAGKLIPYSTKRPGDFSYPKAGELFYPKKWLQAQIAANVAGEHTPHLKEIARLRSAQAGQLRAKKEAGASEATLKSLQRQHRKEEKAITTPYLKALGKKKTPLVVSGERGRFRGAMAEQLKERRAIIQAYRKQEGTLGKAFPPLPGQGKGGYRISGQFPIEKAGYVEDIGRLQERLHGEMSEVVKRRAAVAEKIEQHLTKRGKATIPKIRKAAGIKTAIPHEKLAQEVRKVVHPLLHSPMDPEAVPVMRQHALSKMGFVGPTPMPSELESIASRLGYSSGKRPEQYRNLYRKLTEYSRTGAGETEIKKAVLKSPKFWSGLTSKPAVPVARAIPAGYPHLKRLGIGAAVATGLAGAGYLARRFRQKKETQFAIPKIPKISNKLRRHLIGGGALAGGITVADTLVSAKYPEEGESRARSAWGGAKRGALYGTSLVGAEYGLTKALRKIRLSNRSNPIQFGTKKEQGTLGHDIAIGGIEGAGGYYTTERLIKALRPKTTGGRLLTAGLIGGLSTGTIGYALNRLIRKRNQNNQMRSKLKEIRFQYYDEDTPQSRRRRQTVAQHRYRHAIREQEIARHESNLLRSTLAGATVASLARGKIPLRTAAIAGGAAGLGTQAALIASNRKKKDIYGAPSITTKRVERLPYQVAGGTAALLAARKAYKYYRHFKARHPELRFQVEGRAGRRKRTLEERIYYNPRRVAEQAKTYLGRASRLGTDIYTRAKTGQVTDIRGRPKKPEWEKPWVIGGLTTAAITAVLSRKRLVGATKYYGRKAAAKTLWEARKVPGFMPTRRFLKQTHAEAKQLIGSFEKKLPQTPTEAEVLKKAAEAQETKRKSLEQLRKMYERGFRSKSKPIQFAETLPYWDIRDQRGKSARVYAPGGQKRTRREKYWHEKKSTRDLLTAILLPTVGIAGAGGAYGGRSWLERRRAAVGGPVIKPVKVPGTKIEGVISKEAGKVIKKGWKPFTRKLSNNQGLIEFSELTKELHRRMYEGDLNSLLTGLQSTRLQSSWKKWKKPSRKMLGNIMRGSEFVTGKNPHIIFKELHRLALKLNDLIEFRLFIPSEEERKKKLHDGSHLNGEKSLSM